MTGTHCQLVRKGTLSNLVKLTSLAKWLSVRLETKLFTTSSKFFSISELLFMAQSSSIKQNVFANCIFFCIILLLARSTYLDSYIYIWIIYISRVIPIGNYIAFHLKAKVYNFFHCLFQFIVQYICIQGWQVKRWSREDFFCVITFIDRNKYCLILLDWFSVLILKYLVRFSQIGNNRLWK